MNKIKSFFQHPDFVFWGAAVLWVMLVIIFIVFLGVIFIESISTTVSSQLDIKNKSETLKFIGLGMSGILAAIGAVAINRRATAQVKNVEAQVENNRLIEKGHIDDRFKSATENLGSEHPAGRISAFYQFYYLAKDNENDNLRENILDILCAHIRNITSEESYKEERGKEKPTEECQILLNILFKSNDKSVFGTFSANLKETYLVKANLAEANLEGANFERANLMEAKMFNANLSRANFCEANLMKVDIGDTNLSGANLESANLEEANIFRGNLSYAKLMLATINLAELASANLSRADLSYAKLMKANLSGANLLEANLSNTKLLGTHLSSANLSNANLSDAWLSGAYLMKTKLPNANLSGADLTGLNIAHAGLPQTVFPNLDIHLLGANLSGADLSDANLSGANLSDAHFIDPRRRGTNILWARLTNVGSIDRANFCNAKVKPEQLPTDKGKYYADWNPLPKKEEN